MEKHLLIKRLEETSTLRRAIHRSQSDYGRIPFNKAQQALAIAHAARQTLIAEEELASERVVEVELRLQATREALQAAKSKLTKAERQISHIMNAMDAQRLLPSSPVDSEPCARNAGHHLKARHHSQHLPSLHESENGSDISGFKSFYDAPSRRVNEPSFENPTSLPTSPIPTWH